jgi:hypothetical protein
MHVVSASMNIRVCEHACTPSSEMKAARNRKRIRKQQNAQSINGGSFEGFYASEGEPRCCNGNNERNRTSCEERIRIHCDVSPSGYGPELWETEQVDSAALAAQDAAVAAVQPIHATYEPLLAT